MILDSEKVIYIDSAGSPFEMLQQETHAEGGDIEYFINFLWLNKKEPQC